MSTWINGMQEFNILLDKFIDRIRNNNHSQKNTGEMLQMAGAYYEMINSPENREILGEAVHEELSLLLLEIQGSIENGDVSEIEQKKMLLGSLLQREESKIERAKTMAGIFESDVSRMKLHEEKIAMCQNLVDLDMKLFGQITDETVEVLNVQNVEVVDGKVSEKQVEEKIATSQINESIINQEEFNRLLDEHWGSEEVLMLNNRIFENITFPRELYNINFTGAEFRNCTFDDVNMEMVRFPGATIKDSQIADCRIRNCNLIETEFVNTPISETHFRDVVASGVQLKKSSVDYSTFDKVDMKYGKITDTVFNENYFTPDFVKPEEYRLTEATPEEERGWKEQLENAFTNDHFYYKLKEDSLTVQDEKNFTFVLAMEKNGEIQEEMEISGEYYLDVLDKDFLVIPFPEEHNIAGQVLHESIRQALRDKVSEKSLESQQEYSTVDKLKEFVEQHGSEMDKLKGGDRKTLVVNAYAGPGAGKTTACLETVAELKKMGYVAEYVPEYAKELVYENSDLLDGSAENQLSILLEQTHRVDRLIGKVDVVVTDAPILLNTVYGKDLPEEYAGYVKELYGHFDNFNFFVERGNNFEQEGRIQNHEESIQKDEEIKNLLKENKLFFGTFNHETIANLASRINVTYNRLFKEAPAQNQEHSQSKEQSYRGTVYLKGNGEKETKEMTFYGDTPEQILARLRGWNETQKEDAKINVCYIRKLNTENNKYENPAKYEIATGNDITPIYLNLPHLSRTKYMKLVDELKQNGAKYNPVKKAFFVTKQSDLNAFKDYLPIAGTQAEKGENRSRKELPYEIEAGKDYYDNRVQVSVEGMDPFNVYGDAYGVHFPSMSSAETKEIVEKFVLPNLEATEKKPVETKKEYNGKIYNMSQYNVILKAESQNFSKEQLQLLERPELTSDQLNEIRFAIRDGLSAEQIMQFATPEHAQWQMDICRVGMQHGLKYSDMKNIIDPTDYTKEDWSKRRNMLNAAIKEKNQAHGKSKPSVLNRLHNNQASVESNNVRDEKNNSLEKKTPVQER